MNYLAWGLIITGAFAVLARPFSIGKPRDPITAEHCAASVIGYALDVILMGRILGWW